MQEVCATEDPKVILNRARNIQIRIDRRQAEIRRLHDMETYISATSYDSPVVSHSVGRGSVEQIATSGKLEHLERKIQKEIDAMATAKADAIALISTLEDTRMTELLWEYYIHAARTWEEAAAACNYSERQALRIHGEALQLLRMSLNVTHDMM